MAFDYDRHPRDIENSNEYKNFIRSGYSVQVNSGRVDIYKNSRQAAHCDCSNQCLYKGGNKIAINVPNSGERLLVCIYSVKR